MDVEVGGLNSSLANVAVEVRVSPEVGVAKMMLEPAGVAALGVAAAHAQAPLNR